MKYAEIVTAKASADRLPLLFDGMGEGRTDEIGWQLECRRRIRGARVVVVLVSPHTAESTRVRWQVQCAREIGVPVLGITVSFGPEVEPGRGLAAGDSVDSCGSVIGWKWKTVAATLMRFVAGPDKDIRDGKAAGEKSSAPMRQGSAA
ncbi:MAG: TIR domain-containing protein [Opitutaceae bacterium]|nr:TIR domain-containing protein [Opitutaceae bacterium]